MSGPMSSRISKLRLSLASPPVRRKVNGSDRNRTSGGFWWRSRRVSDRELALSAPFCARCRNMGAHDRRIDHLDEVSGAAHSRQKGEIASKTPLRLSRQNRFQTLFQIAKLSRQR